MHNGMSNPLYLFKRFISSFNKKIYLTKFLFLLFCSQAKYTGNIRLRFASIAFAANMGLLFLLKKKIYTQNAKGES